QPRDRARFLDEAIAALIGVFKLGAQHLEGDLALHGQLNGAIDRAHAALADARGDDILVSGQRADALIRGGLRGGKLVDIIGVITRARPPKLRVAITTFGTDGHEADSMSGARANTGRLSDGAAYLCEQPSEQLDYSIRGRAAKHAA